MHLSPLAGDTTGLARLNLVLPFPPRLTSVLDDGCSDWDVNSHYARHIVPTKGNSPTYPMKRYLYSIDGYVKSTVAFIFGLHCQKAVAEFDGGRLAFLFRQSLYRRRFGRFHPWPYTMSHRKYTGCPENVHSSFTI